MIRVPIWNSLILVQLTEITSFECIINALLDIMFSYILIHSFNFICSGSLFYQFWYVCYNSLFLLWCHYVFTLINVVLQAYIVSVDRCVLIYIYTYICVSVCAYINLSPPSCQVISATALVFRQCLRFKFHYQQQNTRHLMQCRQFIFRFCYRAGIFYVWQCKEFSFFRMFSFILHIIKRCKIQFMQKFQT